MIAVNTENEMSTKPIRSLNQIWISGAPQLATVTIPTFYAKVLLFGGLQWID